MRIAPDPPMTEAQTVEPAAPADSAAAEERSGTLAGSALDVAAVAAVVLSLFFERLDRRLYLSGTLPIPDITFDAAVVLFSLRYLHELVRGRVRLARPSAREWVAVGFVLLILALGAVSLATLPGWMTSGTQVVKTTVHLGFLAYAALLIGRALSRPLLELALKLYFWLTAAAAALAIVQAVDLNVGHGAMTRHLHLIFRAHPNGYDAPVSVFSEPAHLGYACVAALVVGILLVRQIGTRPAVFGCVLCALALLLSLPAGPALVGAVLAVLLLLRYGLRVTRRTWGIVAAVAVLCVAVGVATPVGSAISHRFTAIANGSDPSGRYRTAVDSASIKIWRYAPATGVGIGNSRRYLPALVHLPFEQVPTEFNDSDAYLSLLGEAGPVGVAGLLLLVAAFAWPARRRSPTGAAAELNVLGVALSFFVAGAFLLPPLWFWGGLRLADARQEGEDRFGSLARLRRGHPRVSLLRPNAALWSAVAVVAVLGAAGAFAYGVQSQRASARSLTPVPTGRKAAAIDPRMPQPGDPARASHDARLWLRKFCGHGCRSSLFFVSGRYWGIWANWGTRTACVRLDVSKFTPRRRGHGLYDSFRGMRKCRIIG